MDHGSNAGQAIRSIIATITVFVCWFSLGFQNHFHGIFFLACFVVLCFFRQYLMAMIIKICPDNLLQVDGKGAEHLLQVSQLQVCVCVCGAGAGGRSVYWVLIIFAHRALAEKQVKNIRQHPRRAPAPKKELKINQPVKCACVCVCVCVCACLSFPWVFLSFLKSPSLLWLSWILVLHVEDWMCITGNDFFS